MDVPTRQSYVIAVVDPDERSAAAGVTGVARTTGAALSPSISSVLMASAGYAAVPFYLAGGLKILYDLLLYREFRLVRAARGAAPPDVSRSSDSAGRRAGSARSAGHPEAPPDEADDQRDDDDRDREVERLERMADVLPVRARGRCPPRPAGSTRGTRPAVE